MTQWTKRRAAGAARGVMISICIAILLLMLWATGILQVWLGDIDWGITMFFQTSFYGYLFIMILIIGVIMLFVRSTINWGGA